MFELKLFINRGGELFMLVQHTILQDEAKDEVVASPKIDSSKAHWRPLKPTISRFLENPNLPVTV